MSVNKWSEAEVKRAESTWGQKVPVYSEHMFKFAIEGCKSWLDLGCGFGRFLNFLIDSSGEDINYIGYDGSVDMVKRTRERFPDFAHRIFHHDIVNDRIVNNQESVICSAVMIHITQEEQKKVIDNILAIKPRKICFDINSPSEDYINSGGKDFERFIKGAEGAFRMTWQSHYGMTMKMFTLFKNYHFTVKYYPLQAGRHKAVYMLERK